MDGASGFGGEAASALDGGSIDELLGIGGSSGGTVQARGIDALLQTQTVPYQRSPRLEAVFDRLVKLLRQSTRKLTSDSVEIALDRITSVRLGRYLDTISLPALLGIVRAEPWNNLGLVTVDASLVTALTDVVFGGSAERAPAASDGRSFSPIELAMIRRFLDTLLADLGLAFASICPVAFSLETFETNPRFIAITQPQNVVLLTTFKIELGALQGYFDVVLPFATLEPIREALDLSYLGDGAGQDLVWRRHLAAQVARSKVELTAIMHEQAMPLRQIMRLAIGDTLYFNTSPDRPVQLRCAGALVTEGRMGRVGDNIAVQVARPARVVAEDGREATP